LNYLEKIAPSYFELLTPLKKWRILSVRDLKEQSGHNGSRSSFYKIITKLENYLLIDSFINSWSNEKFIYLMPNAIKVLGSENKLLPVNRDQRFHDAIVTRIALNFKEYHFVKDIYLDQEIGKIFPLIEKNPDILITGQLKKEFRLAVEVELTQKSKKRVVEIFRSYSQSIAVNNIIYITDKLSLYKTYLRYLDELKEEINTDKFIFIYKKDLNNKTFNIINSKILYQGHETSLKQLFDI
jgi:hypothetical protein